MIKSGGLSKSVPKVYLTSKGLEEVKAELHHLQTDKRAEITERIRRAREFGDVTENAEYDAAQDEQTMVENRIVYLEDVIKNAKVISVLPKNDFVVIGSTVKVELDGETDTLTIVGKVEANPSKKMISNESPLGSALLGAKKGETVEVATPIVRYKCKVLEIK